MIAVSNEILTNLFCFQSNKHNGLVLAATHTLLDQCAFEQINICGMIQYEEDNDDWVQTLGSADVKDHTLGGKCRG